MRSEMVALSLLLASFVGVNSKQFVSTHADGVQLRGSSRLSPAWDYSSHGNNWYQVNAQCNGVQQSPINVSEAWASPGSTTLFYRFPIIDKPVAMTTDGRVLRALIDLPETNNAAENAAGTISLGNYYPAQITHTYKLRRIEVHTPSEHTFNQGQRVPLELQLVHEGGDGADGEGGHIAIVSIGFHAGTPEQTSRFLDALRQGGLPNITGTQTLVNRQSPAELDFQELFGAKVGTPSGSLASFNQYWGSLTTPPCSVNMNWFVRSASIPASREAIIDFQDALMAVSSLAQGHAGNDREFQQVLGRNVTVLAAKDANSKDAPLGVNATFEMNAGAAQDAQQAANTALGGLLSGGGPELTAQEELQYHGYMAPAGSSGQSAATSVANGVTQGSEKTVCLQNLAMAYEELAASQTRKKTECDAADVAEQAYLAAKAAGNDPASLQAAAARDSQKALCTAETDTLAALTAQSASEKAQCDALKAK